jgi:hypothetical protein
MAALVLVFCLVGSPTECQEQRPLLDDPSLQACFVAAQPIAAEWISEHANWTLKGYRCEIGRPREKSA